MSKRFWIENNEIIDSGFFLSDKEEYVATMNNLEDIAVKWQRKCEDLEAKLAEGKKIREYFADRIEKADREIKENYKNYNKLVEEYNKLKQQLAEKDAEIEKWKSMAERSSSILDRFNYCGESIIYNTTREQDQISFCIQKLKEVKKLFEEKYTYDVEESDFAVIYEVDVDEIIDNQIKQLKEMK